MIEGLAAVGVAALFVVWCCVGGYVWGYVEERLRYKRSQRDAMIEWTIRTYKTSKEGCWYFSASDGNNKLGSGPLTDHSIRITEWGARRLGKQCVRRFLRGLPQIGIPEGHTTKFRPR